MIPTVQALSLFSIENIAHHVITIISFSFCIQLSELYVLSHQYALQLAVDALLSADGEV